MFGQALEHAEVKTIAPVPALDGATGQAQTGEGHHAVNVKHFGGAQAIARGASAHGRVEGEQARFEFGNRVMTHRAGKLGIEHVFFARVHFNGNSTLFCQP